MHEATALLTETARLAGLALPGHIERGLGMLPGGEADGERAEMQRNLNQLRGQIARRRVRGPGSLRG